MAVDTQEGLFPLSEEQQREALARYEEEVSERARDLVRGLVDTTPSGLEETALVGVLQAATQELKIVTRSDRVAPASQMSAADVPLANVPDIDRVQNIIEAHEDDSLRDYVRPHVVDVRRDPVDQDSMERGRRIRFGKRVIEFGRIKERDVPVYSNRVVHRDQPELAFELDQLDRVDAAKEALAAAEKALVDEQLRRATSTAGEQHSTRTLNRLSGAAARARAALPKVEATATEAIALRRHNVNRRGDAAIRAARSTYTRPVNTYQPGIRLA